MITAGGATLAGGRRLSLGVRLDPWLILASVLLAGYGMALIYSGSLAHYGDRAAVLAGPIARQIEFLFIGLALMLFFAAVDYRAWRHFTPYLYVAGVLGLVLVMAIGSSEYGSRRWVTILGVQLQPSEPAKLLTILLLARLIAEAGEGFLAGRMFLITLGVTAVPAAFVFKQPDLGTTIVFFAVWLGLVFVGGARLKHLALLISGGLISLPFVLIVAVHGYQKERLTVFFNPDHDPLGTGFNINQAAISIGSGGLLGKGWTQGTQTQLDFLRTQTTDYIFSVLGEELGFVGGMVLFVLFIIVLVCGVRIATTAPDAFGRLVATGIVVMILTQVFINIGVNMRIFPVTGIPLPFISQGGSSLMTMFMSIGLLQSVHARRVASGGRHRANQYVWSG